jgi:hypothetical protein
MMIAPSSSRLNHSLKQGSQLGRSTGILAEERNAKGNRQVFFKSQDLTPNAVASARMATLTIKREALGLK